MARFAGLAMYARPPAPDSTIARRSRAVVRPRMMDARKNNIAPRFLEALRNVEKAGDPASPFMTKAPAQRKIIPPAARGSGSSPKMI